VTQVSLKGATAGSALSNNCRKTPWKCSNPFWMTCTNHGEEVSIRCGRWRTCPGCSVWKQWTLRQRFLAGIAQAPAAKLAMFATLTFPAAAAPDEDAAHKAWRSLVGRLRYRGYLGAYGWCLQRTKAGVLHYHAIMHLPWFDDGLAEWRELLVKSGFGVQNRLVAARKEHAGYCARYISTRLAPVAPLRRAFGFSADFPKADPRAVSAELAERFGVEPEDPCEWHPRHELH
jgi:hypothetical protein